MAFCIQECIVLFAATTQMKRIMRCQNHNEMLRGKKGRRERESKVELSTCILPLHPLIVRGYPQGDLEQTATSPQIFPQMALAAVHNFFSRRRGQFEP